jgi:cytidine deaminase
VAGPAGVALGPCGICRQVLSEFSPGGGLRVVTRDTTGAPQVTTIAALLPAAFGAADLGKGR